MVLQALGSVNEQNWKKNFFFIIGKSPSCDKRVQFSEEQRVPNRLKACLRIEVAEFGGISAADIICLVSGSIGCEDFS